MLQIPFSVFLAVQAASAPAKPTPESLVPQATPELATAGPGWGFQYSPDGRQVAWLTVRDGKPLAPPGSRPLDVIIATIGEGPRARTLHPDADWPDTTTCAPAWLPDGSALLVAYAALFETDRRKTACVDLLPAKMGDAKQQMRIDGARVESLAVSRDGKHRAVLVHEGYSGGAPKALVLHIFDGAGAPLRKVTIPQEDQSRAAASISPDGTTACVATGVGLFVVGLTAGEPRKIADGGQVSILATRPSWSDDGKEVIAVAGGALVHASLESGQIRQFALKEPTEGRPQDVVWLPGTRAAAAAVHATVKGGPAEPLVGAGRAPKRGYVRLRLVDLDTGTHRPFPEIDAELAERGRLSLPYVPRLSELMARPGR
ncbi:MAG: hypothetical protein JNJ88_16080 [Planctomycetes bacterium]|nr:hypothetical protein [Planctomycetota bacterium]